MAKQAVVREVKSMTLSCDPVGNLLLVKMSFAAGKDACFFLPAHIVFWLLNHLPVNQDPNLTPPPPPPVVEPQDWDDVATPRVDTLQCKEFPNALRMHFEMFSREELVVLLNRNNIELLRQFLENYRGDLMDLGIF
ncbi:hypothetical protein [Massilia sp. CF038]|uniref:hypothetical protein n=1 Tax=Massilia sp. CF038 TaxID=1881045 RepID=UPI00091A487D|nr:hypothetical protein [Massilia sp. CF038]SHG52271.1 hypothetical protein SAMN05428948_0853 [Massilia sp. CF038]